MDESTTDKDAVQTGDSNESLPEQQPSSSADEQKDAASGDESHDSSTSTSGKDSQSSDDDDDGLARFAKSQGIDSLDDLSDRERKLLKSAHDSQKDFHKKRQEAKKGELGKEIDTLHDPKEVVSDDDNPYVQQLKRQEAELAALKSRQRVRDFWEDHPEAREYEAEMRALVTKEKDEYGADAARQLTRNLERLYKLAKLERGDANSDAAVEQARREEREALRRKQEGSADSGSASTNSGRSSAKVDKNWVENVYDPSNSEHRKMLDEALASGKL